MKRASCRPSWPPTRLYRRVIMPHATRKRLSRVLAMLRNKKLEKPMEEAR